MVFDLERLDIADPSFLLAVDIRGQFGRIIVSQSLTEIRKSEGTIVNVVSMRLPS